MHHVLVISRDPLLVLCMRHALKGKVHTQVARDTASALHHLEEHPVDMVLWDQVELRDSGEAFFELLSLRYPEVLRVSLDSRNGTASMHNAHVDIPMPWEEKAVFNRAWSRVETVKASRERSKVLFLSDRCRVLSENGGRLGGASYTASEEADTDASEFKSDRALLKSRMD